MWMMIALHRAVLGTPLAVLVQVPAAVAQPSDNTATHQAILLKSLQLPAAPVRADAGSII